MRPSNDGVRELGIVFDCIPHHRYKRPLTCLGNERLCRSLHFVHVKEVSTLSIRLDGTVADYETSEQSNIKLLGTTEKIWGPDFQVDV
jgi:hypothetical protein